MTTPLRAQRACLLCSIVQPTTVFTSQGCPNCEELLQLRGSPEVINEMTSQVFEGLISLHDPSTSWVAKWQRLSGYVPGTYATKVVGRLPEDVIQGLEDQGIKYFPRDGSNPDEEGGGEPAGGA
jgi:transcription elongation factor SPT4